MQKGTEGRGACWQEVPSTKGPSENVTVERAQIRIMYKHKCQSDAHKKELRCLQMFILLNAPRRTFLHTVTNYM